MRVPQLLALSLGVSFAFSPLLTGVAHANPPQDPRITKPDAMKLINSFLKARWAKTEKASFGKYPGYKITLSHYTAADAAAWKFWDAQSFDATPKGFRGDFAPTPYSLNGSIVTSKSWNSPKGVKRVAESSFPIGFGIGPSYGKLHF